MSEFIPVQLLVNSIIFSIVGAVALGIAFVVLDRLTPYHLWTEVTEKQNLALAILVGCMIIGLSIIIGAAVHG